MILTMTNVGRNLIRDALAGLASPKITYVAVGAGTTPPAATDTQLQNEFFRKPVTTYTNGTNPGEIIIALYLAPGDAVGQNVQEFGFFGGSATSAFNTGTLLARGLYAHPSKENSVSIQFVLDFTSQ